MFRRAPALDLARNPGDRPQAAAGAVLRHSCAFSRRRCQGGPAVHPSAGALVDSATELVECGDPWLAVGISYAGLEALGLPQDSLQVSPKRFAWAWRRAQDSLETKASTIRKIGTCRSARVSPHRRQCLQQFRRTAPPRPRVAREQFEGFSGVSVLADQDFGAQPGDRNSLGYKDGIDQPAIEGSGVDPLPGQGRPIKAGEFILGYPGEAGVPLPMPQPDVLGRNGTFVGFRKYQTRVGAFNRFLRAMEAPRKNVNCSPRNWSAVGAAAHR